MMEKPSNVLCQYDDLDGLDINVPPSRVLFGTDMFCKIFPGVTSQVLRAPSSSVR